MKRLRQLGDRWPWLGQVLDVTERVGEVHGGPLASSVTLTLFVSLFPLALLLSATLGFFEHGNTDVAGRIIDHLSLTGSAATTVRTTIETAQRSRKAASIVGLLGLLWAALAFTTAIGRAVCRPWQVKVTGMRSRIEGGLWLVGALVIGAASAGLGALLRYLPSSASAIAAIGVVVLGLIVEVGFFLWTFWMLGDRRPGWRALLPGAILGALGLEVLKVGATVYLPHLIARSSAIYGSLGVVFAIIAWLALFARLLVYSSTLNAVRYEHTAGTVTLAIEATNFPDSVATRADRGGAIVVEPETKLEPAT